MKQLLLITLFLLFPFVGMNAAIEPICMQPKDDADITTPIKRTPMQVPMIGIDGKVLVRLQGASAITYQVEILQDNEVLYSTVWNFQDKELVLPNNLKGEYNIQLSDGSRTFIGIFYIE